MDERSREDHTAQAVYEGVKRALDEFVDSGRMRRQVFHGVLQAVLALFLVWVVIWVIVAVVASNAVRSTFSG